MAPPAQGGPAVSSLTERLLGGTGRLLVPDTLLLSVRAAAESLAIEHGLPVHPVVMVGSGIAGSVEHGDTVVHGLPDVFGRLLPLPRTPSHVLVVRDAGARTVTTIGPDVAIVDLPGDPFDVPRVAGALRLVAKRLLQVPGVRFVFEELPPLAAPLLAPLEVEVPEPWCRVERPVIDGLPDLVIVRPVSNPPTGGRRRRVDTLVVA